MSTDENEKISWLTRALGVGTSTMAITGSASVAISAGAGELAASAAESMVSSVIGMVKAREARRIEISLVEMIASNARLLASGAKLRVDWSVSPCASAEEIVDATLHAVMEASESRKVKHLSCQPIQIAYDPDINPEMAHRLVELGKSSSFIELVVLQAMSSRQSFVLRGDSMDEQVRDPVFDAVISLMFKGLITPSGLGNRYGGPFFNRLWVSASGQLLIKTMELSTIDAQEISEVLAKLDELATAPHPPGS